MAPKKMRGETIGELPFATIQNILDHCDPDLTNFGVTDSLDFNTLLVMLCFMTGWSPNHDQPENLGGRFILIRFFTMGTFFEKKLLHFFLGLCFLFWILIRLGRQKEN